MNRPIKGIFPALTTAYDKQGEFDPVIQKELVNRLLSQGAHGFFVAGTTSEFPVLTLQERESLAELVVSEVTGQVPIVVHVATPRVTDAVRLAQHAARLGAKAISSIPPYYYPQRLTSVMDYLREIATATDLPFYYYHIPGCTGQSLDIALLDRLLTLPNFAGLKYSDPNFAAFQELKQHAGPDYQFVCGHDSMFLSSLLFGGEGAVGSMYNFLMPLFLQLWKAYTQDDLITAREIQERANRIINVLGRYPNIAVVKETLRLLDLDVGEPRPPLSYLEPGEKKFIATSLTNLGLWEIKDVAPAVQDRG